MSSAIDLHKVAWRKSSRSSTNGQCVEVACIHTAPWRKSTRSASNGNCVEVAPVASTIAVRDSKLPTEGDFPHLLVDTASWSGLLAAIKTGHLALINPQTTEPAPPSGRCRSAFKAANPQVVDNATGFMPVAVGFRHLIPAYTQFMSFPCR